MQIVRANSRTQLTNFDWNEKMKLYARWYRVKEPPSVSSAAA